MTPDQFYLVTGLPTFAAFIGIIFTLNQRINHLHDRLNDLRIEMAGRMDRQRDLLHYEAATEKTIIMSTINELQTGVNRIQRAA